MGFIKSVLFFIIYPLLLLLLIFSNFSLALFLSEDLGNFQDGALGKLFYLPAAISLILIAVMFVLTENKLNFPIILGIMFLLASTPAIMIKSAFSYFEKFLSPISAVFSGSYKAFIIFFSIGVILVSLGIGLRFMRLGFNLSRKFEKEIVEEKQKLTKKKMTKKAKKEAEQKVRG